MVGERVQRVKGLWLLLILASVAAAYFALAKLGLLVAQVHPNATPIWPPAGFALATLLLWGPRVWPAIFAGALVANDTTAGSLLTSTAIAAGNSLEALSAYWLLTKYSDGSKTFDSPIGVAKFAAVSVFVSAPISASIGVASLVFGGFASTQAFSTVWITWWLGNVAGVLVLCPAIVLWFQVFAKRSAIPKLTEALIVIVVTLVIGIAAFAPLVEPWSQRSSIAFLSVIPLLWASLRLGSAVTSTVSIILVALAIWGTLQGYGPFGGGSLNQALLNLLSFMVSASVPSLALSAELSRRLQRQKVLDDTIHERTRALDEATETIRQQSSERQQTRKQLIEQAIHFREAQRLANLGSWSWDVASNNVSWSDQLYAIYGIAPDQFEATFESYLARIHQDDREMVREIIERALTSENGFQTEERIVRPNGEIRYLRTSGEVLRDESGKPIRMLGICADVTEERSAAAKLSSAQEQLIHFQKLEALGKLTGGVAHDFNNLLMIVGASAEYLGKRISDTALLVKLDAIKIAVERGTGLTRQLLTFSRQQILNPVTIDLNSHLMKLSELLKSSLRGDISLSIDLVPGVWSVKADVTQLELSILNLAVNARDAMPEGGEFRLTAKNVELKEKEVLNLAGDFVALTFEDVGTGILPEHIGQIFDPFFTTKQPGAGTGLGLAQVYGFAQASGGAVTVSSEPGRTRFNLYLPRSFERQVEERKSELPRWEGRGRKVLIVEDNVEVGKVTADMLSEIGYIVDFVDGGEQGIEKIGKSGPYDLVITDVVMPGSMDGVEFANIVRKAHPNLPIVVMSGYLHSKTLPIKQFTVLKKPFDVIALNRAIDDAMQRSASG